MSNTTRLTDKKVTLTKKEFRLYNRYSERYVSRLLNKVDYEDIKLLGYKKNSKKLPEAVVRYYFKDWCRERSPYYLHEIYDPQT